MLVRKYTSAAEERATQQPLLWVIVVSQPMCCKLLQPVDAGTRKLVVTCITVGQTRWHARVRVGQVAGAARYLVSEAASFVQLLGRIRRVIGIVFLCLRLELYAFVSSVLLAGYIDYTKTPKMTNVTRKEKQFRTEVSTTCIHACRSAVNIRVLSSCFRVNFVYLATFDASLIRYILLATLQDVLGTRGTTFEDYGLKRELRKAIHELGFESPTPIQEEAIQEIIMGSDVLARAKNGTGKTAAYLIPILQQLELAKKHPQAVIILPTRELSLQTSDTAKRLGKYLDVQVVCTTGGTSVRDDILRLQQTAHLLIGTPGRLLDLMERGAFPLEHINVLVLDEADKMLDHVFSRQIGSIISLLPADRQLLLFSATFPKSVQSFMGVTQYYAYLEEKEKLRCLKTLFGKLQIFQSIIFCSSVKRVEILAKRITAMGFPCFFIHSSMDQRDRNKVFQQFRDGKCRHLVCTDLFTRGIDVAAVNVVINFDFPQTSETYLHRIGRSGRGGRLGLAISFVTPGNEQPFHQIEQDLGIHIDLCPEEFDKSLYVDKLSECLVQKLNHNAIISNSADNDADIYAQT
eukprot:gene8849-1209_t